MDRDGNVSGNLTKSPVIIPNSCVYPKTMWPVPPPLNQNGHWHRCLTMLSLADVLFSCKGSM